jgi:site-specific DNA-methyltransferase (adenine-specific)
LKYLLGELELNRIYQMDCLEGMSLIPDKSIDMILCDLPYGTTQAKWDSIIPFEPLWEQYKRIIKNNGAIVLFGSQPFTSALVMSNPSMFRYEWIWNKVKPSGHLNAKIMPMKQHENILVFSKGKIKYYPKMEEQKERISKNYLKNKSDLFGKEKEVERITNKKYPKSIITFSNANQKEKFHPTQKPVALFEYLIKTYTNEGEIVLDNCMGSGTTAVAATLCNRKWIGFEIEPKYIEIANKRLEQIELHNSLNEYK